MTDRVAINLWNQQILEELQELVILLDAERLNLITTQNQIDFEKHYWTITMLNLIQNKAFIQSSITDLETMISSLRNKLITCC